MTDSINVRLQRPEDDEELAGLLEAAFGGWPKVDTDVAPVDHLRWKRLSHQDAANYHCVAEFGGRIVGAQLYFVQDIKVGPRILRSANGVDICVHPEYQRRGVRTAMMNFSRTTVERETPFLLTVDSGHPAMLHLVDKMGIETNYLANKLYVLECDVTSSRSDARDTPMRVRRVDAFDERTDDFCAEASEPFQLIVVRDRRYLNWRYADKRAGKFAIYLAEEADHLIGYVTASVSQGKGCIADLLVLAERVDAAEALLNRALSDFAGSSIRTAQSWSLMHHPYQAALSGAGFSAKRRTLALRTRPRAGRSNAVGFSGDPNALIHIMAGDSDLV